MSIYGSSKFLYFKDTQYELHCTSDNIQVIYKLVQVINGFSNSVFQFITLGL